MFGDPFANLRRIGNWAPTHQMRTFAINQPLETHFRRATCAEVECPAHLHGWKMGFDLSDPDRVAAARAIRDRSGRKFTAEITGGKVVLTFPAGQRCFNTHRVPVGREPLYVVRGGDWRGNPRRERAVHKTADTFVDQWENDLDKIKTLQERG